MARVVLRIRLCNGDHLDVVYAEDDTDDVAVLIEHVIDTLAKDGGALRATHNGHLFVLFGRGVASVEPSPRGAVL